MLDPSRLYPSAALVLLAALLGLAVSAVPAHAGSSYATFRATISGTYVNEGTLTSGGCYRFDDDEGVRVALPPMRGAYGERTTFRATRSMRFGVSRTPGERRIVAGGKAIPVRVTTTRTSELATPTTVRGCRPADGHERRGCGTRTQRYRIGVFGVRGRPALSYGLSDRFTIQSFDDPFDCPYPEGSSWWGGSYSRGNGEARVSTAKLFDPRIRTVVVRGGLTRDTSRSRPREAWEATGRERLRWTLTLRRIPGR